MASNIKKQIRQYQKYSTKDKEVNQIIAKNKKADQIVANGVDNTKDQRNKLKNQEMKWDQKMKRLMLEYG